jgi:hypothetical protein
MDLMSKSGNIYCQVTEIKETGVDMKLQWGVKKYKQNFCAGTSRKVDPWKTKKVTGKIFI